MTDTLYRASREWATRPDDEKFLSMIELQRFAHNVRNNSRGKVVATRQIEAIPVASDPWGLQVAGPDGNAVDVSHWAFGQLAQRAGAPAHYLRNLPGALAADNINYGLHHVRDVEDIGVLLYKPEQGNPRLNAVTGPGYGRIWNATIIDALVDRFGDGVTGRFRVPGEFGVQGEQITKQNTTLYASDRDFFVFLADESRRITIKNRRNGEDGELSLGFFAWNSEVGKESFGIAAFGFDYMCGNHIVWGVKNYRELRIRHTSNAPHRMLAESVPYLEAMAADNALNTERMIAQAQQSKIGDEDTVKEFLAKRRFSGTQVTAILAAHVEDEGRPVESLWDASTAITAYARSIPSADRRVEVEREAGRVLDMVA